MIEKDEKNQTGKNLVGTSQGVKRRLSSAWLKLSAIASRIWQGVKWRLLGAWQGVKRQVSGAGARLKRVPFALRIWLRVRWRLSRLWWKEKKPSLRTIFDIVWRPGLVALVGVLLLCFLDGFESGSLTALREASPFHTNSTKEWRAKPSSFLLFVGVPIAFVLWAFRDYNARATINNQRKDVNLKQFAEVQQRASGVFDEKLPAEARMQSQIAALHQLPGFMRGDFGTDFRRPAFELLLAGHAAAMERIGLAQAIAEWRATNPEPSTMRGALNQAYEDVAKQLTVVDRARMDIIGSEWVAIFRGDFPLHNRNFDRIDLPKSALLDNLNLANSSLRGASLKEARLERADLSRVHLERADLWDAHLEGADLWDAHLEGADLRCANLDRARLSHANLEGADLSETHLEGADLWKAHLEGVRLSHANLKGARLSRAHLEGARLSHANLEGAKLMEAHLESADLSRAHLEGANLMEAHLEGADLIHAHLEGADLIHAHLEGADLSRAHLEGASMVDTHLEGATLIRAHLEGTNLEGARLVDTKFEGATIDDDTELAPNWSNLPLEQRTAARQPLINLGAIYTPSTNNQ